MFALFSSQQSNYSVVKYCLVCLIFDGWLSNLLKKCRDNHLWREPITLQLMLSLEESGLIKQW